MQNNALQEAGICDKVPIIPFAPTLWEWRHSPSSNAMTMAHMSKQQFLESIGTIAKSIEGRPLTGDLQEHLNKTYPPGGPEFSRLKELCFEGERDGWLMNRVASGIKYGRAVKPGAEAGSFSVDVVRMKEVKGPHHIHTNGEIGAIMRIAGSPTFDEMPEGWYVYGPGSDHHPTVTGGDAYVLYLLPEGAIEFTGR
jgi:hypothetical protein